MADKKIALSDIKTIRALARQDAQDGDDAVLSAISAMFTGHLLDEEAYQIIIFHDWDDTVIGAMAVPTGKDCRAAVNEYVKANMIHPDLREQTAEGLASLARADSYRGEYPYTGPDENDPLATGGENTVTDGAEYPLTNHLDYVLYGKDKDAEFPFVSCWAIVDPETMEDTFTALSAIQTPEAAGLTMADFSKFSGGGRKPSNSAG